MAVTVSPGPVLDVGVPRQLFDGQGRFEPPLYDVASDRRFLRVQSLQPGSAATEIVVVLNWMEELKEVAPVQ